MPGTPVKLGPFEGGLHNSGGSGDFIEDNELYSLVNLEVDLDKTLANRPAVRQINAAISGTDQRILGMFDPENSTEQYLCVYYNSNVRLIKASDGTGYSSAQALSSVCAVQYNNRMWVVASPGSANNGGYFDSAGTWTTVAAMPRGEAVVIYQDRMFIGAGLSATSNSSRMYWSELADPTTWSGPGGGSKDIEAGNGEKLTNLLVLNQDLVVFKEHSTFRFGYSRNITSAETIKVNSNIGCPSTNCAAVYNNNSIYVLHDNSVYELYNFTYTRMSQRVTLTKDIDGALRADSLLGLTIFRDRMFVRYYANMYVYNLRTATWSQWAAGTPARKFAWVLGLPSTAGSYDTAWAAPALSASSVLYFFRDDRLEGVGGTAGANVENFDCSLTTKTYDFDVPQSYKVLFHWGVAMASNGNSTGSIQVPNASANITWDQAALRTWDDAAAFNWDTNAQILESDTIPPERGDWARKYLKFATGKRRFRQIFFTLSTAALSGTVGDAAVRIYDMTSFMLERETVFKRTS